MPVRRFATAAGLSECSTTRAESLQNHTYVDRAVYACATELITRYGAAAADEASARADHSRALGNVITFCLWRQAERTIAMLSEPRVFGTVH